MSNVVLGRRCQSREGFIRVGWIQGQGGREECGQKNHQSTEGKIFMMNLFLILDEYVSYNSCVRNKILKPVKLNFFITPVCHLYSP